MRDVDTPRCVIEAAHARWVSEAQERIDRQVCVRVAGLDPDGPLEPMRPAVVWQRDAEWRAIVQRADQDARDAALVAALKWT
ncbi:MAG TPA: hypothetical protein VEW06_06415 [Xanthobacteraceae bacterium]|nr:hypothetical protein [Xanthobacteraceae bacterium]